MTTKEYNEKALSNREIVELADAMGLGEFASMRIRGSEGLGDMRTYEFMNGDIYVFQTGRVRANVRIPRVSVDIEIATNSLEEAAAQARALGIADYVEKTPSRRATSRHAVRRITVRATAAGRINS